MRFLIALLAVCIGATYARFPLDVDQQQQQHQQQYDDQLQLQPMPLTTSDYLKMKFGRHPSFDAPAFFDSDEATIFDIVYYFLQNEPNYKRAVAIADRTQLGKIVDAQDLDSFTMIVPADFAIDQWRRRVGDVIARNITVLTDLAKSWIVPNFLLTRERCFDDMVLPTLSKDVEVRVNVYNNRAYLNGARIFNGHRYTEKGLVVATSYLEYPVFNGNAYDLLEISPDYSKFVELIRAAGLGGFMRYTPAMTVFAPSNDAFSRLDAETSKQLTNKTFITSLLKYHIVPRTLYKAAFASERQSFPTALVGKNIGILNIDDNILLNNDPTSMYSYAAQVLARDVTVTNGVLHGIDNIVKIPK